MRISLFYKVKKFATDNGFHKLNGQIYRVFTASFLHASWLHLIANIIALVCVGFFIEKKLGHLKFLVTFLISDVFARILFYYYFNECSNGNGSSIVIHSFSFFVGLIIGLLGMKSKLIHI